MNFFGFSLGEYRGYALLLVVATLCLALAMLLPSPPSPGTAQLQAQHDSLLVLLGQQELTIARLEAQKGSQVHAYSQEVLDLKPFDPNMDSEQQLLDAGLPAWLAQRLVRYRAKAGPFRNVQAMRMLYGMTDSLYASLLPYVRLPQETPEQIARLAPVQAPAARSISRQLKLERMNLNTADTLMLQALPGIGSYRARKIVTYRQLLGGYIHTHQLAEVNGLDSALLSEVLPYLYVEPGFRPQCLDVNTASENTLKQHPYMPYTLATLIVKYRKQHGPYASATGIKAIKVLGDEQYDLLAPYLCP